MSDEKIKIIITGGHITPALATIRELQKENIDILFIGRKYTDENKSLSVEKSLVEEQGIKFQFFESIKLNRNDIFKNLIEIFKFPKILYKAATIVRDYKPNVILSFGGYLSLPIAIASFLQDVPIIAHEQTSVVGLTNRLIEPMVKKLAVSWPTTKFGKKRILTGNPIRKEFTQNTKAPNWYQNPQKLPVIYVTGGNQGSKAINTQISKIIGSLAQKYYLVLQAGSARNNQDLNLLTAAISKLPVKIRSNVHLSSWFNANDVAWIMRNADLVVSRSGANTATEILVNRAKSILIPLPSSAAGEQYQNARLLERLELAFILDQQNLQDLENQINLQVLRKFSKESKDLGDFVILHTSAAAKLAKLTIQCAQK